MVVCGDVFESNLVDRKTVSRVLEALNARRARG
jgi:DNA repair exonuclease SbcCD nuclease subunit